MALTMTVVRSQVWGRETKIPRGRIVGSYCLGVRPHFYLGYRVLIEASSFSMVTRLGKRWFPGEMIGTRPED